MSAAGRAHARGHGGAAGRAALAGCPPRPRSSPSLRGGPTPTGVVIVARGSSDYAAIFGRYLIEAATGTPVALAAPSLETLYDVQPRLARLAGGGYLASRGARRRSPTCSARYAVAGAAPWR